MLAECLRAKQAGLWTGGMPGVQACCFALDGPVQLTPALEPRCFEALFCRCGCLRLDRGQNRPRTVGEREILLLSDVSSLSGAWVAGRLEGVLVAVDANAAGDSLRALCAPDRRDDRHRADPAADGALVGLRGAAGGRLEPRGIRTGWTACRKPSRAATAC